MLGSTKIYGCLADPIDHVKAPTIFSAIFKEKNIDYSKANVFMCGSGVTACVLGLAYFLITGKNAVIYDGSFAEWGKK